MSNIPSFRDLLSQLKRPELVIVGIDPGETTGICLLKGAELMAAAQLPTGEAITGAHTIWEWITKQTYDKGFAPERIVAEEYRVYAWKAKQHSWSNMHTSRLIGGIDVILYQHKFYCYKQGAQIAKQFCTDDKLKAWGFWQEGKQHARDAIRHAAYFALFHGHGDAPQGVHK